MKRHLVRRNGLEFHFYFAPDQPVRYLLNPPSEPGPALLKWASLVEVQVNGGDPDDHHGNKYTATDPGRHLRYHQHRTVRTPLGYKLEIIQRGGDVEVISHLQFLGKLPAFRSWTTVRNLKKQPLLLEYVSTFALAGVSCGGKSGWDDKMQLHVPDNSWCGESQWRSGSLAQFGLSRISSDFHKFGFSINRISVANLGTWSTVEHLPMGALENRETGQTLFWQIENNGSWHWEVSDGGNELFLHVSGPTYRECHWSKRLALDEIFTSVPATIGLTKGGLQESMQVLTQTRRLIRRPHVDMKKMPVIFNDYMNCLDGDPTTERLLPVIESAAKLGCEYFVIDAGWYAERNETWWASVGKWQPSQSRFPNGGLKAVIDRIHERGMIPGLWLEIEVMGIHCSLVKTWPKDCFFQRNGIPIIDHGRYQLDFRHPKVRAHADEVVDRLVSEFGVGYFKMDYNINAGPGTDRKADAPGDGLLQHNRAYLEWLEGVFERHPKLVIENCSSGGLRLDYALLSRHSIQSTTDQTDYRLNAAIAAASASAVTPEQAAVWSYPLAKSDDEEVIMNMVNVLLSRIHQSGRVHEISPARLELIREALTLYKGIRSNLRDGIPFWPLGLPRLGDDWAAYGLHCPKASYLAVWRFDGAKKTITLPLGTMPKIRTVECLYPQSPRGVSLNWQARSGNLDVTLPQKWSARLLRLR
ncbi:MAG: alpha-galactosidase [Verrucomicrobia bacterium Tous-C9LFEB]|nr:MAG: alpha-galactosidase [Verrucomicrobia bacterium Tous-C9LFEB]